MSGELGRGQSMALLWSKGTGDVGRAINKQNNHGEVRDAKRLRH